MVLSLLKQSDLFKKIPGEALKALIPLVREKTFTAGSVIFSQNSKAEKVYLLEKGQVALKTSLTNGLEITYEMITQRGDPFGWSALIEPYRHMTTALCLEDTGAVFFNRKDLSRLFPQHPLLGFKVMQNLSVLIANRLERTRRLLVGQI
ncbi:MAG: cyclic nucleotide-binding domain-containing protein [Deltaproteobacteria bacterium]|nr:cyclic nucleotide-binding domain-containing protein [Deltaproteobacteria bacterium]